MTAPATGWLDAQELAAWVGLIKVATRVVVLSDAALRREHGITGRDYELLHHLSEGEGDRGRRLVDLARVIDDSSSCITHRVNRLAAEGLVEKQADLADGRARRIRLTPAGRRLLAAAAPAHVERVRRWVIDPLDARDLDDLARVTARLNAHLRSVAPVEPTPDAEGGTSARPEGLRERGP